MRSHHIKWTEQTELLGAQRETMDRGGDVIRSAQTREDVSAEHFSQPRQALPKTHLYKIHQVQEKLLGILLSVRGEFWVTLADKGLKHTWRDPILLRLKCKNKTDVQ